MACSEVPIVVRKTRLQKFEDNQIRISDNMSVRLIVVMITAVCVVMTNGNDDSNSLLPLMCYDRGRGTDKMVTVVCFETDDFSCDSYKHLNFQNKNCSS